MQLLSPVLCCVSTVLWQSSYWRVGEARLLVLCLLLLPLLSSFSPFSPSPLLPWLLIFSLSPPSLFSCASWPRQTVSWGHEILPFGLSQENASVWSWKAKPSHSCFSWGTFVAIVSLKMKTLRRYITCTQDSVTLHHLYPGLCDATSLVPRLKNSGTLLYW